jgi:hypothetical protein
MRARFVLEKFIEDSDPIKDMGIGMTQQIKDWLKKQKMYRIPDINNTDEVLYTLLYTDGSPNEFIDFLLDTQKDFDENRILDLCFRYNRYKFIDKLLQLGAKFSAFEQKAYYVTQLHGKLASLTPDEEMTIACKAGDFNQFLRLLNDGVKVKIGLINAMMKHDYMHNFKVDFKGQDKIMDYLREHIDEIEDIIHPRDHSKLDKIRGFLNIKKSEKRGKYPQGYKIYRVLKFIDENKPNSKKEIVKFIVELTFGKGTFNPLTQSSYWSDAFASIINPRITKASDGTFILNAPGKTKLKQLEDKFGPMNIKALV